MLRIIDVFGLILHISVHLCFNISLFDCSFSSGLKPILNVLVSILHLSKLSSYSFSEICFTVMCSSQILAPCHAIFGTVVCLKILHPSNKSLNFISGLLLWGLYSPYLQCFWWLSLRIKV
ncbi:hypothetical protein EV426DRAFT_590918 [Tirmania nivea]|nr:hypothetical protein EV426DRAFT_590918 [Tirmania nivea]